MTEQKKSTNRLLIVCPFIIMKWNIKSNLLFEERIKPKLENENGILDDNNYHLPNAKDNHCVSGES